ncbi:hypothetical protein JXA56_03045 [Candidatus Micrarchaeota archaeon]|nr:hypothetical protein [Candidatus Micrarchaeota archaeon]
MTNDPDLEEAINECAKIIEEKCKKRPYMVIISKANLGFESEEDKQKGVLKGNCTYLYIAKPQISNDPVSSALLQGAEAALDMAKNTGKKN